MYIFYWTFGNNFRQEFLSARVWPSYHSWLTARVSGFIASTLSELAGTTEDFTKYKTTVTTKINILNLF